ncbi:MAG: META domain-containing protein [Chloroflexi bacterium]|nr:META domain-containing protein [Chloroflexota bacterium]
MPVLTVAVLIALGTVISACGTQAPPQNAPTITEAKMSEPGRFPKADSTASRWPPEQVQISREQAVEIATNVCTSAFPEVTAVENPHDPVTRLMPIREFEDRAGGQSQLHDSDRYVWVVQFEGESFGAGLAAPLGRERGAMHRYAGCAVDAQDEVVREEFRRGAEPLLLPSAMLNRVPSVTSDVNLGSAVEARGAVNFDREAAIALAQDSYGGSVSGRSGGYFLAERAEAELIRYTGICHSSLGQLPAPTPTPGGPPETSSPPRGQCGVEWGSEDSNNRLTWLVIIPVELELGGCGGPGGSPRRATCWSQPVFALIDAESGEQYGDGGAGGLIGPLVTNEEQQALTRFAWTEGWWELWHRLRDFAGQPLPDGFAASLDRPDAPTPTPRPTSVIPAESTSTPTPTPTPPPPRSPTATPFVAIANDELVGTYWELESLDGERPVEGTTITLAFTREYLLASAGCNHIGGTPDGGRYQATNQGSFAIRMLTVTAMLCSSADVMRQERTYVQLLLQAASYQLSNDRLEMADSAGRTTLVFTRQYTCANIPGIEVYPVTYGSLEELASAAEAIVQGTVVDVDVVAEVSSEVYRGRLKFWAVHTFKVSRVFKGEVAAGDTITLARFACKKQDGEYILFLRRGSKLPASGFVDDPEKSDLPAEYNWPGPSGEFLIIGGAVFPTDPGRIGQLYPSGTSVSQLVSDILGTVGQ